MAPWCTRWPATQTRRLVRSRADHVITVCPWLRDMARLHRNPDLPALRMMRARSWASSLMVLVARAAAETTRNEADPGEELTTATATITGPADHRLRGRRADGHRAGRHRPAVHRPRRPAGEPARRRGRRGARPLAGAAHRAGQDASPRASSGCRPSSRSGWSSPPRTARPYALRFGKRTLDTGGGHVLGVPASPGCGPGGPVGRPVGDGNACGSRPRPSPVPRPVRPSAGLGPIGARAERPENVIR